MKVKLAIVEDNVSMLNHLKEFFTNQSDFEVVATCSNGLEAVSKIDKTLPDIVLLDIVLPDLDGFGVMSMLQTAKPKFLVLSGLSQESFVTKALKSGASYYMIKPFDIQTLKERILDVVSIGAVSSSSLAHNTYSKVTQDYAQSKIMPLKNKSADEKISNIFIAVGIPAHVKGYHFLREAIKLTIDNPEIINSITKKLYPSIAEIFATSSSKVERAIRHAIEISWNRGKIENINNVFGIKIYSSHEKPTNGEFIALVADKLLIEGA